MCGCVYVLVLYCVGVCMYEFCNVWVYVCVRFVTFWGCVCVFCVICGCVCVGCVICGCVYVWVL